MYWQNWSRPASWREVKCGMWVNVMSKRGKCKVDWWGRWIISTSYLLVCVSLCWFGSWAALKVPPALESSVGGVRLVLAHVFCIPARNRNALGQKTPQILLIILESSFLARWLTSSALVRDLGLCLLNLQPFGGFLEKS